MPISQHFLGDGQGLGIGFQRLVIIRQPQMGHADVVDGKSHIRMPRAQHLLTDVEGSVEIDQCLGMFTHRIIYRSDITVGVG